VTTVSISSSWWIWTLPRWITPLSMQPSVISYPMLHWVSHTSGSPFASIAQAGS
jgi:hypothetical protein